MLVTRQITGVAAGSALTDAVNVAQLKEAIASVKPGGGSGTGGDGVHYYSVFSDETESGSNYDNKGATGANALAAGVSASATGAHSVAVGNGAQAVGQDSIALGTNAKAEGTGATAIGQYNTASGQNSLAFGGGYNKSQKGNTASGVSSVAFGQGTQAIAEGTLAFGENTQAGSTEKDKNNNPLGQNAVAFGNGTKATGGRSLAFGERTVASANDATAFGNESVASNMGATAFGNKNQATGQYATAWGGGDKTVGGTKIGTVASGTYATAFGERTEASGESATAFGSDSTASGKNSLAFGEKSTAAGDNSLAALGGQVTTSATNAAAIGKNAQATFADSVALGSNSVTTRAKYSDLTDEKKKAVYIKGDSTGSAWEATDNAIAVGNDSKVTRQITGVAAGSLDTDAVNVAQLKKMAAEGLDFQGNNDVTVHRDLGQKLTIQGEGKKADTNYSGENLKVIGNTDGSLTIKMDKDIKGNSVTVGEKGEPGTPGKDGVDGTIGVNGKDGSAVVINGRDGSIGLNGKDGANGLTIKGADGAVGVDGTDGHDGKDGMTRIVYEDNNKTTHEVATLDDGLKFKGDDDKVITKKLNEQLDIVGGAQGDLTDKNIAVKSTADGKLKVQMAKKLTDLTSVTTGNTTIDNSGLTIKNGDTNKNIVITDGNVTLGGNQVNNMGSGSDGTADGKPTYNTLTNGANIGDVKNIVQNTETDLKTKGLDFQGNNDVTVHRDLGQKLTIQGEGKKADTNYSGENLKVIGNTDGSLTIKMDKDIKGNSVTVGEKGEPGTPGKDGVDGTIGVNGKDGSAVVINGRDGSIGLNGKDGANGLTIKGADGAVGVDGTDGHDGKDGMTRIVYEDNNKTTHEVATLDDGLKFKGDDDKVITKKLNEQLDIVGGAQGDLTDKNIAVKSTADGKLKVQMAKKLTDLTSVTTGNTTIDNSGLTIKNGDTNKNIVITDGNVTLGGNQVNNMGSGSDGTADGKPTYNTLTNGANIGDVKNIVQNTETDLKTKGLDFQGNNDVTVHRDLGQKLTIQGEGKKADTNYSGENLKVIGNTDGSLTIKMDKDIKGNSVTVGEKGEPGTPGKDGVDGTIGVNGKDGSAVVINGRDGSIGLNGKDGANGLTIKGADGAVGVDGTDGHDGKDGMTRIVYEDNNKTTHEVATLDDGLKFKGDDDKVITKKLNEQLDIVGGAQGDLTDKNIAVKSTADGKLKVQMAKKLTDLTSVTTGNTTIDNSGLTIKNGDTNKNIVITDGNVTLGGNQVNNMGSGSDGTADGKPTYNTLTNGANIGDVKNIVQNTETDLKTKGLDFQGNNDVTVHRDLGQKLTIQGEGKKADTNYSGENLKVIGNTDGSLTIKMDKDIKGNSVTVGEKGEPGTPGKDGVDGTIGVNGKDGSAVVINGRDGSIGLNGKDGANGLTIKGADGAVGVDGTDGHDGKDGMTRIVYEDNNKTTHEVATLDDGLKFVGNDGKVVIRKLNTTLSIKGGITETDALKNASTKNLGVRQNSAKDGLEIVMTDTPDFTKVTVGEGTNTNSKITIGKQTVTGKKADGSDADKPQTGNYITGLDNKAWDKDNVVADRAATEGQLKDAINDISGKDKGGFGLADEKGGTVKKDLGDTVTVKGDGKNIETKVNGDALEVSLKKDVDLGKDGSIKAGETTIDKDGVKTNEIKVGDITITKDGINGGAKQITNIASGIDGKQYATVGDNNAASIGDVKKIAGEEAGKAAEAVKSKSGKNITVKDDHTVNLNDNITLGDETDASKQVSIDGNGAKVTAGDGTNQVTVDGSKGQVTIGSGDSTMTLGKQANTAGDRNPENGNYLNGLDNKKWDGEHIQSGRAATEDQLKTVSDKVNSGRVFQGDDGKEVKVGMGDTLKIQGGVKAEDVSQENNIGIVKGADDTLNIRLAKDLKGLDSVTTGNTAINNSGLTVKGDDNHKDITIHQDNVNMGGNKVSGVADGKVSKDSTDAVNGSQLWQRDQAINGLSGSVNKLGNRINRVGAGAAALAALHPLDFDPDDKWDFAAGYGNYRGANAAAIGAYYRPNEDTMFSVGGSFGGGENMVNAGVSIKLGQGNHVSTSRVAMAKEMKAMRQHMAEQDALIAKLQSMHGMAVDPAKSVLFPDVAENHWAYQYVTTLAKKGILEGYPDGEFKGDRMMTRYEFAAIVYRIVESGVGSTDPELSKLVKEFSPELQYIRIDTIQKDRNGKPTIERVRVISDAK
ncbi:MAG: S-layer homology domain-containing protein [Limosilactobacillus oris]|uniref:S-layer homology domain-containing protein n=1 Tax=Megasphaera sp. TaxID=2023260 RepID=UPI0025BF4844|nr:S-layer homology domain-containing protein [Megasphaera sp.]MCH3902676.1 S-layer homology domain-containing protein [Limosilactobacillus oris]MCH3932269.1 S-layer homology domain-containing protein [Megasphaera sp.]